jgi:hypothetical protein
MSRLYTSYNWDVNIYSTPPDPMNLQTDVLGANWEKRRAVESALLGKRVFQAEGQMIDEDGNALS